MNSLPDFPLQIKPPNNRTTPIADIVARLRSQLASPVPAITALTASNDDTDGGMLGIGHWFEAGKRDPRVVELYSRHYSAKKNNKTVKDWLAYGVSAPGENMVLLTADGNALFVWSKQQYVANDQQGVNCAVFRNESSLQSSALIREAMELAWQRWPGQRLYTYVDSSESQSTNPGYCFKKAGWSTCGKTKKRGLIILECWPTSPTPEVAMHPASSPQPAMVDQVQLWPTLARLAIASGEGPQFRLWALLSEYSRRSGGPGWCRATQQSLNELAVTLGIMPRTMDRLVKSGDGIYWSRGGGRLWQTSAAKLYEHLQDAAIAAAIAGCDEPNRRKVFIPLESFSSLELFYSTCFNAWLMDRRAGELMVTWKVLTSQWGRNRAALNRWMQLQGIQRTENWGKRRIGSADRRTGLFDVIEDPDSGNPNMVVEAQGQLWLMYQRGNTYYSNQSVSRARRGAFKLLNASSGNSSGASPRSDAEQWQRHNLKANFRGIDAQTRYRKKHGLPDISYTLAAEEVLVGIKVRGRKVWRAWEADIPTRK